MLYPVLKDLPLGHRCWKKMSVFLSIGHVYVAAKCTVMYPPSPHKIPITNPSCHLIEVVRDKKEERKCPLNKRRDRLLAIWMSS